MTSPERLHFDRQAEIYKQARPPYPPQLYATLREWGALREGISVLELGPGSGQATHALLANSVRSIHAVELGEALARELRQQLPDPRLTVTVGDIHGLELPAQAYDLVTTATVFHWLRPQELLPRLHAATRPGGWLAFWWTVYGDPDAATPFRHELAPLLKRHGMEAKGPPRPLQIEERVAELTQGGHFEQPKHALFRWTHRMNATQTGNLFCTFPDFAGKPELIAEIEALVERLGGVIEDPYVTVLYGVRRAD